MKPVTLVSDLGISDHHIAGIKGALIREVNDPILVDISHSVAPFDLVQTSYLLKWVLPDYPAGSVHICMVDSEISIDVNHPEESRWLVAAKVQDQYVICADNGILGLLGEKFPIEQVVRIDLELKPEVLKKVFRKEVATAAAHLIKGGKMGDLGELTEHYKKVFSHAVMVDEKIIRGRVIYVDALDNVITNIRHSDHHRMGAKTPFRIVLPRGEHAINRISDTFSDVPMGEKLALFNSQDLLQISINRGVPGNGGGAASLLGLRLGDTIRVEYTPRGSANTLEELL